ncbi:MAG: SUMF1/EgtB/PvdO family nonheme iron enzyme [Planctomycetes bacterium]|nr:SUMF1/EgtB/PvdO family nonheme iron enzyme [Planctomycetota bacterium]
MSSSHETPTSHPASDTRASRSDPGRDAHAADAPGGDAPDSVAARALRYRAVAELFDRVCDLDDDERARVLDAARAPSDVVAEVRELLALDADPSGPLPASEAWDDSLSPEVGHRVRRLAAQSRSRARYERLELLGEGGMGAVHVVWDRVLGRRVAMKSLRERGRADRKADDATRAVARFLEEARIAGQLDHPGIVPVHDLGIDASGRLWFTMPLVRGRTLHEIVKDVHQGGGEEGWTLLRVVGLLQRACEAVGYAHGKGVVHRDLKPANVMIGRHGETCVMDWGLARLLGEPDVHDLRLAADELDVSETLPVRGSRRDGTDDWDASPLVTLDGEVLGTPAYMSPEQARGDVDAIGPGTDVYAMGCILYQLLAGRMPYAPDEGRLGPRAIWRAVLEGPPRPVDELAPDAVPELVSICARAMARRIEDRYASMTEMADDLRAFLEGRVVRAHATGALVELRKWIVRNRVVAALALALVTLGVGAGFVVAAQESRRAALLQRELDVKVVKDLVTDVHEVDGRDIAALTDWMARLDDVLLRAPRYAAQLADFDQAHADAGREPVERDRFLAQVESERTLLGQFEDELARIDAHLEGRPDAEGPAESATPRDRAIVAAECTRLAARVARREGELAGMRATRYVDPALEAACAPLVVLNDTLALLAREPDGPRARAAARLAELRGLRARTVDAERAAWDDAIASVADREACPLYDGLVIAPQEGLVPLGRDASSGLWEFWHVPSGERPVHGDDGRWTISDDTGLVLVLVPGGAFDQGAQSDDPGGPNWLRPDPQLGVFVPGDQCPVQHVSLAPYFLSKYELTQGQWLRLTGSLPSTLFAGRPPSGPGGLLAPRISRSHPVESVSWDDCRDALRAWDLVLPTEARWERAARAGGASAFGRSQSFAAVLRQVNFADTSAETFGLPRPLRLDYDDGWATHGPVDAWEPNAWGFSAILGNVREWCLDGWQEYDEAIDVDPVTGERTVPLGGMHTTRGGSFLSGPRELTVAWRDPRRPGYQSEDLGLRPARDLDP